MGYKVGHTYNVSISHIQFVDDGSQKLGEHSSFKNFA